NIKAGRKKLNISQSQLAERAEVSLDSIKSIERGRRSMSLDTYMKIVNALGTTPFDLMRTGNCSYIIDRFMFMVKNCNDNQVEFVLYMVEKLLKGQAQYLKE
ncbi:MAG: helix-turn-helix transcriptional regulator, partial [Lachnospiraceae bacterium]|nr:helix-turn-helix transcriptional regulator [Lachnospiraceae bacterium]